MGRNVLIIVLLGVIAISLGVILVISFKPQEAKAVATRIIEDKSLQSILPRRPPPRATPIPATPTPEPTPEMQEIARRIRARAEDFPFRLTNRLVQPDGQMRVTLDVRNSSGREWPVAYLTISSAYHPERLQYRLDEWKKDEVRSIDYVFPSAEVYQRLTDLRVEDVTSVPGKESLTEAPAGESEGPEGKTAGTLGLWSGLKGAIGVPPPPPEEIAQVMANTSPEAAREVSRGTGLTINLDGLGQIKTIPLPLENYSGTDREVRAAYNEAVQSAYPAVEGMRALGKILSEKPWDEAMTPQGPGVQELESIRSAIDQFQNKAVQIHQIHARAGNPETARQVAQLKEVSDVLLAYQDALERQVRAAHPKFALMP